MTVAVVSELISDGLWRRATVARLSSRALDMSYGVVAELSWLRPKMLPAREEAMLPLPRRRLPSPGAEPANGAPSRW